MDLSLIYNELSASLARTAGLDENEVRSLLEKPKNKDFGDIAFPCFVLAKKLKKSPADCAKELATTFSLPPSISSATPTGPFLNFSFNRAAVISAVIDRFHGGVEPKASRNETVVIDYSSPNIAKPFHVGHLRTTLIGNCLYRLYSHAGYNVEGVNHLGDWGTQFGFVWAGCEIWGKPEEPSVKQLVALYQRATGLRKAQEENTVADEDKELPDVNNMARQYFVDLEEGKDYAVSFWKWCLEISLTYLHALYERLDVSFDHYLGESFYSPMLDDVEKELKQKSLLEESQGAYGIDLGEDLGFARIITPDGRTLYLTRDIATALYRWNTFSFSKSLYVVGAPQSLHFKQLIEVLKRMGHSFAERMEHVAFGHVLGMSTRAGSAIELSEFLDEAEQRALSSYREQVSKRPEGLDEKKVAAKVALAAVVFSNLSRGRIKDVHFSWDHALEFQGDTGPYLLYAFARINSIKERAAEKGISSTKNIDAELVADDDSYSIASMLLQFDAAVDKAIADNEPSHLSLYLLELARVFSKAYLQLKVVGEEEKLATARLALFETTQSVLGTGLRLLGIEPLERM